MLHLVLGQPRSGKSLYAERLMQAHPGSTVYVGTLPKTRAFRAVIELHRERRPAHWGLVELARDPRADLKVIEAAFSDFRNVFIDGLSYYLLRVMTLFDDRLDVWAGPTGALINRASRREGEVIVVDTPVPNTLPEREYRVIRRLHRTLARGARRITLFENGVAMPLSRHGCFSLINAGRANQANTPDEHAPDAG